MNMFMLLIDITSKVHCFLNTVAQPRICLLLRIFSFPQGVKDSKLLNMLTFNFWPAGKDLPGSIETFLVMLGRVTSYRRSFGDNPVTVLCL